MRSTVTLRKGTNTRPYTIEPEPTPLLAVALHGGHGVRPEVAAALRLDESVRLREEDPCTARWTSMSAHRVVVHRSRFEVDLNRPRRQAVYRTPAEAWGLDVWGGTPPGPIMQRSLEIYDRFYRDLERVVQGLVVRAGGALVYDLHSYNHRRGGPSAAPAPQRSNPDVNLGTGALDRGRWGGVVDAFLESMGRQRVRGRRLDVRENVRFRGGHLCAWVSEHFPRHACALAIEVKKTFMDEWSHEIDEVAVREIGEGLARSAAHVVGAFQEACRRPGG
jgi:N-formylglutamate deformylase